MIRWFRTASVLMAGLFVFMVIGLWLETALHVTGGAAFALYAVNRMIQSPSAARVIYLVPLGVAAGVSWWGLDLSLHSHEVGILYVHGVLAYIEHALSVMFSKDGMMFSLVTWANLTVMALIVFVMDPSIDKGRTA
ncbi:hypothetical protein C8P63_1326 [Melghirimyces profundicolus]|uniref:Uncharacterized protein n=1 Tax=Melghirimyces profundicolus TaxID=1242148 RepID=A0A2T6B7B3_9BACL|nr:hypothetical protein [Melghirimyces profundicolus]PTX51928.1 hypothetical protein C8P63_1326 [Melghirimyces profundicolus]